MRHFFYQGKFQTGERIPLSKEESSHALNALRLGKGETVVVSNGEGLLGKGKIWNEAGAAQVEIESTSQRPLTPYLEIWQATLKGPKMDWLVEKLTELGVRSLRLLQTERTVAQTEKVDRWEKISTAALKQSENPWRLQIHPIATLEATLAAPTQSAIKLFLSPSAAEPLMKALGNGSPSMSERIILVIGPEGGLSPQEESQLIQAGFQGASLHQNILRGETAGIVAAALASHWLLSLKTN